MKEIDILQGIFKNEKLRSLVHVIEYLSSADKNRATPLIKGWNKSPIGAHFFSPLRLGYHFRTQWWRLIVTDIYNRDRKLLRKIENPDLDEGISWEFNLEIEDPPVKVNHWDSTRYTARYILKVEPLEWQKGDFFTHEDKTYVILAIGSTPLSTEVLAYDPADTSLKKFSFSGWKDLENKIYTIVSSRGNSED